MAWSFWAGKWYVIWVWAFSGSFMLICVCQKISYAKGRSNIIAKLDGTLVPPKAAATVALTSIQQSIFNAPVPGAPTTNTESPAPQGSPAKPPGTETATDENRGTKRPREEEEEEESDSDVAMEEDSDED